MDCPAAINWIRPGSRLRPENALCSRVSAYRCNSKSIGSTKNVFSVAWTIERWRRRTKRPCETRLTISRSSSSLSTAAGLRAGSVARTKAENPFGSSALMERSRGVPDPLSHCGCRIHADVTLDSATILVPGVFSKTTAARVGPMLCTGTLYCIAYGGLELWPTAGCARLVELLRHPTRESDALVSEIRYAISHCDPLR